MTIKAVARTAILLIAAFSLADCGRLSRVFSNSTETPTDATEEYFNERYGGRGTTIWEALRKERDDGSKTAVNRYIWNASLEVLDFLPIQSVDPFSGVIVTGYGTPPGGGRAYRATVYIKDPALDARSLNVSIMTRGGPVAAGTQRAVEDAILTRARQLRSADRRL